MFKRRSTKESTKVKAISSRVGGFEENIRDGERLSKSNQTGFFHQFKSTKGKSKDTFDSLETIDSRKSVPFAALPDTTRASTSSPSGDKEDLHSIFSDEVSTNVSSKNSRVLFTEELPTEDMDEDGVLTEKKGRQTRTQTALNRETLPPIFGVKL